MALRKAHKQARLKWISSSQARTSSYWKLWRFSTSYLA